MFRNIVLFIFLCSQQGWGAQSTFYQQFLRALDTNDVWGYAMTSPVLVDINNTTPKLTNAVLSFIKIRESGEIAGIRLGMTMDDVVSKLGRPPVLWSANRGGGPCFQYTGLTVIFIPSSNCVWRVVIPYDTLHSIRFEKDLSVGSTLHDWIRVMGQPTDRGEWHAPDAIYLAYESPAAIALVTFDSEKEALQSFRLELPLARKTP